MPFEIGQEIPLGMLSLRVTGWEPLPDRHAPITPLAPPADREAIVVFVGWTGLSDVTELDRRVFLEQFLKARLRVDDGQGDDHDAVIAMPRELYQSRVPSGWAPPEWAVAFHVPPGIRQFTLLIEFPDARAGAFGVASVLLR